MATIDMCERCGSIGVSTAIATIVHHASPHGKTNKKEICPVCYGQFIEWLTAVKAEMAGNAFREPWTPPAIETVVKTTLRESTPEVREELGTHQFRGTLDQVACNSCGWGYDDLIHNMYSRTKAE